MSIQHQAIKASEWLGRDRSGHVSSIQLKPYGALLVTVEAVGWDDNVPVEGSNKTKRERVIKFREWSKPVIVSARCNQVFLQNLFGGTSTRDWPGKQVWIYYDPTPQYGGEERGGFRFAWGDAYSGQLERRKKGQPKAPPPPKPTPIPTGPPRPSAPIIDPSADPPPDIEGPAESLPPEAEEQE